MINGLTVYQLNGEAGQEEAWALPLAESLFPQQSPVQMPVEMERDMLTALVPEAPGLYAYIRNRSYSDVTGSEDEISDEGYNETLSSTAYGTGSIDVTELWPEHMQQALNSNTPMVLVNGRMSDSSFRYARPLAFMFRGHIRSINRVLAISEHDAQRFEAIGVERSKMVVTGNLKLDVSIGDRLSQSDRAAMKTRLGLDEGFVLLGSSTWPGEEVALLETFKHLRKKLPDCRLMLVPRHAERRGEVRTLLESSAAGFNWHFKSEGDPDGDVDILVGDTSGELRVLTQLADLAFIGKSLPPHKEGQTPIECGLLGVPMVFGPGMNNFLSIREGLLESGSAEELPDEEALQSRLVALALDEEARESQKRNQEVWAKNSRGALERTVEEIDKLLHR